MMAVLSIGWLVVILVMNTGNRREHTLSFRTDPAMSALFLLVAGGSLVGVFFVSQYFAIGYAVSMLWISSVVLFRSRRAT
jgi:hypothetical protein